MSDGDLAALRGWSPEARQAAREKIDGAANVSQAFARSLLDALDAALTGGDLAALREELDISRRMTETLQGALLDQPGMLDVERLAWVIRRTEVRSTGPRGAQYYRRWAERIAAHPVALSQSTPVPAEGLDVERAVVRGAIKAAWIDWFGRVSGSEDLWDHLADRVLATLPVPAEGLDVLPGLDAHFEAPEPQPETPADYQDRVDHGEFA